MPRTIATIALTASLVAGPLYSNDQIKNPSFEYGWSGWEDTDPSSISGHAQTGEKSAKIQKSPGRFQQNIKLHPNSEYILRAAIKGPGAIGLEIQDKTLSQTSTENGENWITVEVPFFSADQTSTIIFGSAHIGEGRFDDFELIAVNGPALEAANQIATGPKVYSSIPGSCENVSQLRVKSAIDDGTNDGHTPGYTYDADFSPESRWSSKGEGKTITFDLGIPQTLKEVGLAFYKGNERTNFFSIETSTNGSDFSELMEKTESHGISTAIERFDFDDRVARYVRVTGLGNASSEWNSIVEFQAYGCGFGEIESQGDGSEDASVANVSSLGLITNKPPAENFDLTNWKITLPVDQDQDGRADEISETLVANGWDDSTYFYTDPATGGMVFRVFAGTATTQKSKYSRVELREMLRGGDETIATRNDDGTPTKNNWVFSAAPQSAQDKAGAVNGKMSAKLAVNQVSRLGDGSRIGRVIIGQIHAKDGEPIRLYYRKLPTNKYGSIYYIHEMEAKDDIYVPLIGGRSDFLENPDDGIALDEHFSYEISVTGEDIDGVTHPMLNVSITRDDGTVITAPPLDMSDSNYAVADEFMYFKAGAYSQNNSTPWPERDFDQVTFFDLKVEH